MDTKSVSITGFKVTTLCPGDYPYVFTGVAWFSKSKDGCIAIPVKGRYRKVTRDDPESWQLYKRVCILTNPQNDCLY